MSGRKAGDTADYKERFFRVWAGTDLTIEEAARRIDRTRPTIYRWIETDKDFKGRVRQEQQRRKEGREISREVVPDFPVFCEEYLGFRLFWHQLQWFDLLEGRPPRDLHTAQTFTPGADPHLLLVNTPPGFAKSTTITAAYTLWRLLKDPNTQAVIVSKNEPMAKKWMFQIQDWLMSRTFERMHRDFGPLKGFKEDAQKWTTTQIYFGAELRDKNAKDPTLEVLGMHGTIYGARADLIILDDVVDTSNAHEFDKQIEWITGMVLTRPADEDKVLIIGTRVSPVDLYKELMNPQRYDDTKPPWTYFAQPAVLETAPDPEDWVTLWPRSNVPKKGQIVTPDSEGLYPKWDGPSLARMRKRVSTDPFAWPLKYQQEDVDWDAVFPREAVYGCVNGLRKVGPLTQGAGRYTPYGAENASRMYVIAGLDPASEGHTAAVCYAVDPVSKQRYVLDVHNEANMVPHKVRDLMTWWTTKYGIQEWRVEKVLLSSWITQDREIRRHLSSAGASLVEHQTTGRTKWDAEAGVMSLAVLFQGWESHENLIELPNTNHEGIRALTEQLCNFFPGTRGKTDCLMALWFAEVRARELCETTMGGTHADTSPWESEIQTAAQVSVSLTEAQNLGQQSDPWWG